MTRHGRHAWIRWLEIGLLATAMGAVGAVRYARISATEGQEIHLEAGLLLLQALEAEHLTRAGTYLPPDARQWRPYLPWMVRYRTEVRFAGRQGWSVVVHADLDGDGEPGSWRIDQQAADVTRVVAD